MRHHNLTSSKLRSNRPEKPVWSLTFLRLEGKFLYFDKYHCINFAMILYPELLQKQLQGLARS